MHLHQSAVYASHASHEYHSTYLGHPIVKATSWITRSRHWFSNEIDADTLADLKARIRQVEGKPALIGR